MDLSNKRILITGASSGIGKAFALKCAQNGATVILSSRNTDKLNAVKLEVEKLGGKAIVVSADVSKEEDIRALFLEATKDGALLDAVLSNAGLGFVANIDELTTDQIRTMIDVNLTGNILVSKFAAEVFVRQKYGHLLLTSSLAGLITLPQWSVYCATKWGLTGFADSIRPELKKHNVLVTTIHPGAVQTEFFDKDKANIEVDKSQAITAEEVADAIYDALFTEKRKVLIPTLTRNMSLMYKYAPKAVELMIEKMTKDVNYNSKKSEDEPEFSYIKPYNNN